MYIHLDTTDSTNSHLRRMIDNGAELPDYAIVYATEQTAGRGQRGNSWESEPGENAIFSLLCYPIAITAANQFILSQVIALSIADTLSKYTEDISIKWPNDIYWNDKKISGTLIECDLKGKNVSTCIIGCGININQTEFLSDAPNPVSLKMITGKTYDPLDIIKDIAEAFQNIYRSVSIEGIRARYLMNLYRYDGRFHLFEDANGQFEARIYGVEPSGHLLLHTADYNLRRYEFKEVKFIIPTYNEMTK